MPTYAEWLADTHTDRVVLAELQPAEHLTGTWTSQGPTHPNVFATPWASFIATSVVAGGVYRRLDYVRQNGTTLTVRASVALCNSNLGSYYLDTSANVLYVSTTTGSSPATFAAVAAYFTLFVATTAKDFAGGALYEPRLSGALPVLSATADDPFTPVKTMADGTVALVNAHAFFDAVALSYIWQNKLVTLHLGGGTMLRADYAQVATARIDSIAVGDATARLAVRSLAYLLERAVPLTTITASEFPFYFSEEEASNYKPLLYGWKRDIPAPCVDAFHLRTTEFTTETVGFADVYLVADAAVQVLTSVVGVRAVNRATGESRALAAEAYSVNLSACTVTVTDATFRADEWRVLVEATGETDGAGGYLDTFGEIARDLLLTIGEATGNIDTATFTAADAAAPFALGLWIQEPVQASEVITLLQQSVIGAVYVGRDGRWRAYVLDVGNTATAGTLVEEDFASWEPVQRIDPIYPLVRVFYDTNPATGEDELTTAEDTATRWLYDSPDGLSVKTVLTSASDAAILAQRYRLLSTRADVQVECDMRGLGLMTAELYDRLLVTRSRAPGGSLSATRMEVLAIERSLDPVRVRVRLGNLGGLSGLYGLVHEWADDTIPVYGSASGAQRAEYGFWHDDNNEVSAGVSNVSVWW